MPKELSSGFGNGSLGPLFVGKDHWGYKGSRQLCCVEESGSIDGVDSDIKRNQLVVCPVAARFGG